MNKRKKNGAAEFPLSPTLYVHHTSVLSSPVPPVPIHALVTVLSAINLQSTSEDWSARKPDLRSPLKFMQQPSPRKMGVAEAPRWIPATPSTPTAL